jgi:hypothetical protein
MHDCCHKSDQSFKRSKTKVSPNAPAASCANDLSSRRFAGFRFLMGLTSTVRAVLRGRVPMGYEDESGFHFGQAAPRQESSGSSIISCSGKS